MANRIIKFRAWKKSWGFMVLSDLIQKYLQDEHGIYGIEWINETTDGQKHREVWEEDIQIMQFTGLHDKNGKEIYEGDIVKGEVIKPQLLTGDTDENCNVKMVGVVYYDYSGFSLDCRQTEHMCGERYGMCNYFEFMDDNDGDFRDMQIIGNIYENPDLLKN